MPLTRGMQLGAYRILEPLGSGGMGDVYRAHDERLSRDVALKIISGEALHSSSIRRRFELEARTLASLSHPNVVCVYDVGIDAETPYLIAELLDGESLRQLLKKGRVPFKKALDIAVQIAAGLTAAHEAGVVHRDLKPENVMLTRNNVVKVIDFGLAKQAPAAAPGDQTNTASFMTQPGAILGTTGYMSPEQASGSSVDFRSDQFAFGCILYELLAGQRAFSGKTPLETLTSVLHTDPPHLSAEELGAPTHIVRILKRCLAKDPAQRFAATRDLYLDLESARTQAEPGPASLPRQRLRWPSLLLFPLVAGAAGVAIIALWPASEPVPKLTPIAIDAAVERDPKWSPDGSTLVYTREVDGVLQVFTKNLANATAAQITHSTQDCSGPFWSADGTHIYYTTLTASARAVTSGFVVASPLWSVSVIGGQPEMVESNVRAASASPDGKLLACIRGSIGNYSLWFRPVSGGPPKRYTGGPFSQPAWVVYQTAFSPDGKKLAVVWSASGLQSTEPALWIVPIAAGAPYRTPTPPDISPSTGFSGAGVAWFPDSEHVIFGSFVPNQFGVHLLRLNTRTGAVRALTSGTGYEVNPDVSKDGTRIAFNTGGTDFDLYEFFTSAEKRRPLLATSLQEEAAAWSPDGEYYAFGRSGAMGVYKLYSRAAHAGWERPLLDPATQADSYSYRRPRFSPDGQRIAYERYGGEGHIVEVSFVSGTRPVRLDQETVDQHGPVWSPDGQWIAYRRQRKGVWELAKVRSDMGGTPVLITAIDVLGGGGPILDWSPSGEWLAYAATQELRLVSPDGQRQRVLVKPAPIVFGFSKSGKQIYGLRREQKNVWKTVAIAVDTGVEQELGSNELPPLATVSGFGMHPSGSSFVTAIGTSRDDIWMMEGFRNPGSWLDRLLRR